MRVEATCASLVPVLNNESKAHLVLPVHVRYVHELKLYKKIFQIKIKMTLQMVCVCLRLD